MIVYSQTSHLLNQEYVKPPSMDRSKILQTHRYTKHILKLNNNV